MNIALLYGSDEGQTAKIAQVIAEYVAKRGHSVSLYESHGLPDDVLLKDHDAVIVGASIHMGRYQKPMIEFVQAHRETLNQMPAAFFSVCLSARFGEEKPEMQAEVEKYLHDFREETEWEPRFTASFAGAIKFSEYGFLKRMMMRSIVKQQTGEAPDTTQDYEYTDWNAVEAFITYFLTSLETTIQVDS